MRFFIKGIPAFATVLALTLSSAAIAEEKADTKGSTEPKILKAEPAQVAPKGKPTLHMVGDTVVTTSGLKYIDIRPGTGGSPKVGQTVSVHYVGTLLNGQKVDSSRDRNTPLDFTIGSPNIIKGWNEGIPMMKIGGLRKLIIPPDLAYGDKGRSRVPPKATLVFEIELLSVK